jgi:mycofactocin precursor
MSPNVKPTGPEHVAPPVTDQLVESDLLVEDVSIDGMCGVY